MTEHRGDPSVQRGSTEPEISPTPEAAAISDRADETDHQDNAIIPRVAEGEV